MYYYNINRYQENLNGLNPDEYRIKASNHFYYFYCLIGREQYIRFGLLFLQQWFNGISFFF